MAGAAVCLALISPAAADAAGKVNTDIYGETYYVGDNGPNVMRLTAAPAAGGATATLVFTETGLTEGTDDANICTPTPNTVTCTIKGTRTAKLAGADGADELTVDSPLPAFLDGGDGEDKVTGGSSSDVIKGGARTDVVNGRGGEDILAGGTGADVVLGEDGGDVSIDDESGGDRIDLGSGRDHFYGGNNDGTGDVLIGGPGLDTLMYTTLGDPADKPGAAIDLGRGTATWKEFTPYSPAADSLTGIEDAGELYGSKGDDTLIGSDGPNLLAGGAGQDSIAGGSGSDTLLGDTTYNGVASMNEVTSAADRIDAFDGFEDRIGCGGDADQLVADQFDAPVSSDCEAVDARTADPFGVAPQPSTPATPATPAPATPTTPTDQGGGPTVEPKPEAVRDVKAPSCMQSKATGSLRSLSFALKCDEAARVDVSARVSIKRVGNLVLGEQTIDAAAGPGRTVKVKVPRSLRAALGKKFTVRLRIDATDAAGNRNTTFASFKVTNRKGAR